MTSLLKLSRGIDFLNEWIGRIFAWAIFLATFVSVINALLRRFGPPGWSSNSLLELQWYLFGATFMICSAWTWKNNGHVRIDVVSSRLSQNARTWIELFCHFFFLLPLLIVMLYLTPGFVLSTFRSGEVSASVGGLIVWPAKAVIMAGFYLLALQWISEVIKRIAIMKGQLQDTLVVGHLAGAQEEADRLLAEVAEKPTKIEDEPRDGSPRS